MVPLNHILKKSVDEYKLTKSQEKINHLMYIETLSCFPKIKRTGNPNTGSENIPLAYTDEIGQRKMRHANN